MSRRKISMSGCHRRTRLSAGEIELLTQWIEQGASWPEHWSYRAITEQPTLPFVVEPLAQGPLDAGIAVQLERHGLAVRPASKEYCYARHL
ncbi:MAG: hypothetical protein R3B96_09560 [Pirellulaceae bacterium]